MNIQIENKQTKIKIQRCKIRSTVRTLLNIMDCADKELSISFVDDKTIKELNKNYLQRDNSTNVLSFSLQEGKFGHINPNILGDIVISAETAQRDAAIGNLSLSEEIYFLIIHGLLHLLGFNHENTTKAQTTKMRIKEKELFRILNSGNSNIV
ncbi:MAG: rRNA maturation RNase YbeY [Deltaproteobacteria bacterium]